MESIEVLNLRLIEYYGSYRLDMPNFQLRMSDQVIETQFDTFCDFLEGTNILLREVTEARKIKIYNYIQPPKWILERLVPNPNPDEILDGKLIYTCIWAFGLMGDPLGEPIEPKWIALQFVIDNLLDGQRKRSHFAKYTSEEKEGGSKEAKELRVLELMEALYGEQSKVADALNSKNAVALPNRDMEIKL